jgi:hypothetical protein
VHQEQSHLNHHNHLFQNVSKVLQTNTL